MIMTLKELGLAGILTAGAAMGGCNATLEIGRNAPAKIRPEVTLNEGNKVDPKVTTNAPWTHPHIIIPTPAEINTLLGKYKSQFPTAVIPNKPDTSEEIITNFSSSGTVTHADRHGLFTDVKNINPAHQTPSNITNILDTMLPGGLNAKNYWKGLRTTNPRKSTMVAGGNACELSVVSIRDFVIQYELDYTKSLHHAGGIKNLTRVTPVMSARLIPRKDLTKKEIATIPSYIVKLHDREMAVQAYVLTPLHGLTVGAISANAGAGLIVGGVETIHNGVTWNDRVAQVKNPESYGLQVLDGIWHAPAPGVQDVDHLKLAKRLPSYKGDLNVNGKHIASLIMTVPYVPNQPQMTGKNMKFFTQPIKYELDGGKKVDGYQMSVVEIVDGAPNHSVIAGFIGPVIYGALLRSYDNDSSDTKCKKPEPNNSGGGQSGSPNTTPVAPQNFGGGQSGSQGFTAPSLQSMIQYNGIDFGKTSEGGILMPTGYDGIEMCQSPGNLHVPTKVDAELKAQYNIPLRPSVGDIAKSMA
jgi:hypothetical protein